MVETNYLVVGRVKEKSLTTILVPLKSILLGELKMFFAKNCLYGIWVLSWLICIYYYNLL